jgi:hypothetical protein
MASNSQNNLSLVLNQQDVYGVNVLNRLLGATGYTSGTVGQFTEGNLTTTGSTSQTLPKTTILQYLFVNTHATANITVSWTPESATGSVIAAKVGPGAILALWQTSSGASGAITAVALQSDTINATFQQFFGG